jgi:hypothetical protein
MKREELTKLWAAVITEVRKSRPLIQSYFTAAIPVDLENHELTLGFTSQDHMAMETLLRPNNRKYIEQLLSEQLGRPMSIQGEILKKPERELDWEFAPDYEGTHWYSPPWSEGAKHNWHYTIEAEVTEEGSVTFEVRRNSENDDDGIEELSSAASSLAEAKAIALDWHRERYDDNQAEREEYRRRYKEWLMEELENA